MKVEVFLSAKIMESLRSMYVMLMQLLYFLHAALIIKWSFRHSAEKILILQLPAESLPQPRKDMRH